MNDSTDDYITKARKSAYEMVSLRQMVIAMAETALTRGEDSLAALSKIAEHCRQIGAHDVSARIFDRIVQLDPENKSADVLRELLLGRMPKAYDIRQGPAPFVQIKDFLELEIRDKLLCQAIADIEHFNDATVYSANGEKSYDSNRRRGRVLNYDFIAPYKELFLPELKTALKNTQILSCLGLREWPKMRFELQVTNYADNEFFGRHVDDNALHLKSRKVSFVYYLRRTSNSFVGGDLLLYDANRDATNGPFTAYTRIQPLDNSIVFFRSSSLHEVNPIFVDNQSREDGRFSVNGWLIDPQSGTE